MRLDLQSQEDVASAFEAIQRTLAERRPDARFAGVTVQRMIDRSRGIERIVGVKRDTTFGPTVLVGAGGITAEVMDDRAIGLAPVSQSGAARMRRSLRDWPFLDNFRGRVPLNVGALLGVLIRMSLLIADNSRIWRVPSAPSRASGDQRVAAAEQQHQRTARRGVM